MISFYTNLLFLFKHQSAESVELILSSIFHGMMITERVSDYNIKVIIFTIKLKTKKIMYQSAYSVGLIIMIMSTIFHGESVTGTIADCLYMENQLDVFILNMPSCCHSVTVFMYLRY